MSYAINDKVSGLFRRMADVLIQQGDRGFRPAAYRRAADTIAHLGQPMSAIVAEQGYRGLLALPAIGQGMASAISEIAATGRWTKLERLIGELDPEKTFQLIPGVGPQLAERMHEGLGVDTLHQLELAAHDGRLARLPGVGPRRVAEIRASLAEILGRHHAPPSGDGRLPPVGLLLEVDESYRRKASAGVLRRIAPRRFNPKGESWLPVSHEDRQGWKLTALFSNTARAHRLGKTSEWVVVFAEADDSPEVQHTIVTETTGPLKGKRVVRGRENECTDYYARARVTA